MAQVPCIPCGGSGQETYMKEEISAMGELMQILHIKTCQICHGNGTVDDGS